MSPELLVLVGILFFASGFFEKEKAQKISSFVGGLFIAAFGVIVITHKNEDFENFNLLGGFAIVGFSVVDSCALECKNS